MDSEQPIANWMNELRDGDSIAAQQLWQRYYHQLVVLARHKLEGRVRLGADEEDVALSALKSFCRGIQAGRYPHIEESNNLWKLLMKITLHKVFHLLRNENRQKRGGEWKLLQSAEDDDHESILCQLAGNEPSPQIVAQFTDEYERLMQKLPNAESVQVAVLKMEGYSNAEIAARLGKTDRTVERKLNLVRRIWKDDFES